MADTAMQSGVMEVARLIDEAIKNGSDLSEEFLAKVVGELVKAFSVTSDEVAILQFDPRGACLNFVFPLKFRFIGSIPLTITHSLAIRTYKEKRPEIVNNFALQKHPTIFESIKVGAEAGELHPIQKIISAPLISETTAIGVVQVSRKAKSLSTAGADFTIRDLTALMSIASSLSKLLKNATAAQAAH
jgi:hypothetical protein